MEHLILMEENSIWEKPLTYYQGDPGASIGDSQPIGLVLLFGDVVVIRPYSAWLRGWGFLQGHS